jgi:hypothetical protein
VDNLTVDIQQAQDAKKKKAAEFQTAYQSSRGQAFPQMALLEALKNDNRDGMVNSRKCGKTLPINRIGDQKAWIWN